MALTQLQCPGCHQMFQEDLAPGMDILSCPHCGQQMQAPPQPAAQARYYYSQNQVRYGPIEFGALQQLARSRQLQPNDYVVAEGQQQWTLAQDVPGLFSDGQRPGPPPIPRPYDDYYDGPSDNPIAKFFGWVWLHFRRAIQWDLRHLHVEEEEKQKLRGQGVEDATLQRYFAWRRSVLLMVCVPVVLIAIFSTIDQLVNTQFRNLSGFGVLWITVYILAPFAMPVSVVLATILWTQRKLSWRIIGIGWACSFGIPIILFLAPGHWLFNLPRNPGVDPNIQAIQTRAVVGLIFFVQLCVQLFLFLMSITFGIQRACLRLKTLVSESPVPALFLVVAAPVLPVILLPVFVLINQVASHFLLITGILILMGSSLTYLICARVFFKPLTSERQFHAIRIVQWISKGLFWGGLVFLVIYALTVKFQIPNPQGGPSFSRTLLGFTRDSSIVQVWSWRFVRYAFLELPGRALFTVVLVADVFMRVTMSVWLFQKQSAEAGGLTSKMENLHQSMNQTQFFKV